MMKQFQWILILVLLAAISGCSVPNKEVRVYFFKGGELVPVSRELPTQDTPLLIAIDMLLRGPNEQESAAGVMTKIPEGTRSRKVEIEGHLAIIDFNSALAGFSGGSLEAKAMTAQIVYTATSIKGVQQVLIKLQGSDEFTLGSEEYVIDHPLERDDIKI